MKVPAVRPDHPRLFFNAETWPAVKARAEGAARDDLARLLRRCDKYPANPVCSGAEPLVFGEVKTATGTHKITEATPIKPVKDWGAEAAECALAWRITKNDAYLQKAKELLKDPNVKGVANLVEFAKRAKDPPRFRPDEKAKRQKYEKLVNGVIAQCEALKDVSDPRVAQEAKNALADLRWTQINF